MTSDAAIVPEQQAARSALRINNGLNAIELFETITGPLHKAAVVLGMASIGSVLIGAGWELIAISPAFGPGAPYVAAHGALIIGGGVVLEVAAVGTAYYLFRPEPTAAPAR